MEQAARWLNVLDKSRSFSVCFDEEFVDCCPDKCSSSAADQRHESILVDELVLSRRLSFLTKLDKRTRRVLNNVYQFHLAEMSVDGLFSLSSLISAG